MPQLKYQLYRSESIEGNQDLAVEYGSDYMVLVMGNKEKVSGLEWFDSPEGELSELLDFVKANSQLLHNSYSETKFFYNVDESLMVPTGYFNAGSESVYTDVMFGPKLSSCINIENVNVRPALVNIYRTAAGEHEQIDYYFRAVTKRHLHSRLVEQSANASVKVYYYEHFVTVTITGSQPLIIRNFRFENDADILYQVLNACKQTAVDPASSILQVSGCIARDASVLSELSSCFSSLHLEQPAEGQLPSAAQSYPPHFFTAFVNLLS